MNSLTEVTGPVTEPISIEELTNYLRISTDSDNQFLDQIRQSSRREFERVTRRQIMTATYDWSVDNWDDPIYVPKAPLSSVTSIKYIDSDGAEQTVSSADYDVVTDTEPGKIVLGYNKSWPNWRGHPRDITIRFVCGYANTAAVPAEVKLCLYLKCALLYEVRLPGTEPQFAVPGESKLYQALLWSLRIPEIR